MEEVVKAYLAGIVDGEGTVTLMKHHKNETPSPAVTVSNNSLKLLKWIQARVGGGITSKKKREPHHNNSYAWSVRQDRALRFMEEVKDYLVIKKKHAELIIRDYKKVTHRTGKYSPELLKKKNALVQKIRKLNQR